MRKMLIAMLCVVLSAGCGLDTDVKTPANQCNTGWYTAMHQAQPNVMMDLGLDACLYLDADGTRMMWASGRRYTWQGFTNLNERCNPSGIDTGVRLQVATNVTVGELQDVIRYLHARGQKSILLFEMLECVDSPAMKEEQEWRRVHGTSNQAVEAASQ